ncbi:MAG: ABC transporter ATP-binding protein [Thaumarchaeota archaeon]|nr:ABC transporter ATP-binding protein [Nitrososphaerota archaeon]
MKPIVVDSLRKSFGKKVALRNVSFEVDRSEIFGLIGPNGAGKTTTLRILATILSPDGGDAWIMGHSVRDEADEVRRNMTYLPEDAGVYRHITGYEFLKIMADVYGKGTEHVERGAKISGLGSALKNAMGSYSKGMKRRILLASVLMVEPKVVILDEPTSGLDVLHAVHVRNAIKDYVKGNGASAIISSHNMLEVEYLCDRVAFINNGEIIAEGRPRELKEECGCSNLEEVFANLIRR